MAQAKGPRFTPKTALRRLSISDVSHAAVRAIAPIEGWGNVHPAMRIRNQNNGAVQASLLFQRAFGRQLVRVFKSKAKVS